MRRCSVPDGRTLPAFWFALGPTPEPWQGTRRQWGGRRFASNRAVRTLEADLDAHRERNTPRSWLRGESRTGESAEPPSFSGLRSRWSRAKATECMDRKTGEITGRRVGLPRLERKGRDGEPLGTAAPLVRGRSGSSPIAVTSVGDRGRSRGGHRAGAQPGPVATEPDRTAPALAVHLPEPAGSSRCRQKGRRRARLQAHLVAIRRHEIHRLTTRLDQHEVCHWPSWYRHLTWSVLARAWLAAIRGLVVALPTRSLELRLAWSWWRRARGWHARCSHDRRCTLRGGHDTS